MLLRKLAVIFFMIVSASSTAQHIQYREKNKPAVGKGGSGSGGNVPVSNPGNIVRSTPVDTTSKPVVKVEPKKPVIKDSVAKPAIVQNKIIKKDTLAKPVAVIQDTGNAFLSKAKVTLNPRLRKPYVEEQNMCNLMSRPEVAAKLPLVINKVTPEMLKTLKERYAGRLYSITALNMIDERLKYKLKICDKDNGKFRSEYLDKDGNVINDPDLDYQ